MDSQISYWRDWQVQLKRRPILPAIPTDEETEFGPGEQKVFTHVVFTHDAREGARRDPVVDFFPGRSVIGRLVKTRRMIVELVARRRDVRRRFVMRRNFNRIN